MALDAFYAAAKYRQKHDDPGAKEYGQFAEWYFGPKVDYVSRLCGLANGSVFEVGCGFGAALLAFRSRGWTCQGIEPDAHCAAYARGQLRLSGVRTGLLGPDFSPDHKVDVVFSNHAFEHFADFTKSPAVVGEHRVSRGFEKLRNVTRDVFAEPACGASAFVLVDFFLE